MRSSRLIVSADRFTLLFPKQDLFKRLKSRCYAAKEPLEPDLKLLNN